MTLEGQSKEVKKRECKRGRERKRERERERQREIEREIMREEGRLRQTQTSSSVRQKSTFSNKIHLLQKTS